MKKLMFIAMMAISITLSAQTDTPTQKPNYNVKEAFFDTHVTVDGVRINPYNALKLLPDSPSLSA